MNPGDAGEPGEGDDDKANPPPGRRSGAGSASILPYLMESLRTKMPPSPGAQGQAARNAPSGHPPN